MSANGPSDPRKIPPPVVYKLMVTSLVSLISFFFFPPSTLSLLGLASPSLSFQTPFIMQNTFLLVTHFILSFFIACPTFVHASWRMNAATLVTTRLDPIVSSGKVASVSPFLEPSLYRSCPLTPCSMFHDVVGPDVFGSTYNHDEYAAGSCTSLEIPVRQVSLLDACCLWSRGQWHFPPSALWLRRLLSPPRR